MPREDGSDHRFDHAGTFRLEIVGLEAFAAFVAILRGDDLDVDALRATMARLSKSTKELSDAQKADANRQPEEGT